MINTTKLLYIAIHDDTSIFTNQYTSHRILISDLLQMQLILFLILKRKPMSIPELIINIACLLHSFSIHKTGQPFPSMFRRIDIYQLQPFHFLSCLYYQLFSLPSVSGLIGFLLLRHIYSTTSLTPLLNK